LCLKHLRELSALGVSTKEARKFGNYIMSELLGEVCNDQENQMQSDRAGY
jgi:hypothetical protein